MAITTVPRFWVPVPWGTPNGGYSYTTMGMAATGRRVAFVIQCPKAGTLDKFEFRTGTVPNNPDNGLRLSFQDVSLTTGDPDGTQDQFRDITGTISANTWQVPGLMTSDGTDSGTKRTVAQGELLACVVDFVSFVASDSVSIPYLTIASSVARNWYVDNNADFASYAKVGAGGGVLALKYNDGSYGEFDVPYWPVSGINSVTYGNGSTPDERALRFQVPVSMRCVGAWAQVDQDGATDLVLYDNASSVLGTISLDPDQRYITSGGYAIGYFASSVTLSANTTYRLSVKPTSATSIILQDFDVPGAAYQACLPGGAQWYLSTRTDAGAWSDTTTKRPLIGLLFDGVDSGGGSTGSATLINSGGLVG